MDELYLKLPEENDKEKWYRYVFEFCEDNPKAMPLGFSGDSDYDVWLEKTNKERQGIDLEKGKVPTTKYFLMKDNRIIGHLSIRHSIDTDFLSSYGGHIGYAIRPSERRKGYGTKLFELALEECKKIGLTEVLVTCQESNLGSNKVIKNNGGIFQGKVFVPKEKASFNKYIIKIK